MTLSAGTKYYLMSYGWKADQQEYNCNFGGPCEGFTSSLLVSFVGAPYGVNVARSLPSVYDIVASNSFEGANMQFDSVTNTPAPGALALLGLGLAGLASRRRKAA